MRFLNCPYFSSSKELTFIHIHMKNVRFKESFRVIHLLIGLFIPINIYQSCHDQKPWKDGFWVNSNISSKPLSLSSPTSLYCIDILTQLFGSLSLERIKVLWNYIFSDKILKKMTQVEKLDRLGENQKMYRIPKSDFSNCNNPDSIDVLRSESLKGLFIFMICDFVYTGFPKIKSDLGFDHFKFSCLSKALQMFKMGS